jgi:hypothetical protein
MNQTEIKSFLDDKVALYLKPNFIKEEPNPVQNELYIDILNPLGETAYISIYDINGRELINKTLAEITTSLKTHNLVSGAYFYKIYTATSIVQQDKFIKLPAGR